MNDKELADKVVALGVGRERPGAWEYKDNDLYDVLSEDGAYRCNSAAFVRDWRVAGALMERFPTLSYQRCYDCTYVTLDDNEYFVDGAESLPCAIIEACVEALNESNSD